MRNLFFITIYLSLTLIGVAQEWNEHIISLDVGITKDISSGLINSNNKIDVLSVNGAPNGSFTFFDNVDGLGNFSPFQTIDLLGNPTEITNGDIDGDGDIDIVGTSVNRLVWYENIDGSGNFSQPNDLSFTTERQWAVIIADLDTDGDNDIVVNSRDDNTLAWYENLDGLGSFSSTKIIAVNKVMDRSLAIGDIDGDNDLDIVTGTIDNARLSWFRNVDGNAETWEVIDVLSPGLAILYVGLADLDGDNDLDVVGNSSSTNQIVSWKNLDGQGTFSNFEVISTNVDIPWNLFLTDLDNDNDVDILVSSAPEDSVFWFENLDGQGNYGKKNLITNNLDATITVCATDIDGDGDQDVISGAQVGNKLAWYENPTILNVPKNALSKIKIYPNPVQTTLFIENTSGIPLSRVRILDAKGQTLLQKEGAVTTLDISQLATGLYVVQLENSQGEKKTEKLVKE